MTDMNRCSALVKAIAEAVVLLSALAVWHLLWAGAPVWGAPPPQGPVPAAEAKFVPGEILVKLKGGTVDLRSAEDVLTAQDLSVATPVPALSILKLKVPAGQELERARALQALPGVEYAEPNYIAHLLATPNDPGYQYQWGLSKINAPTAWDFARGSSATVIAIVDTGIDGTHLDLAGKIVPGYNCISMSPIPTGTNSDDFGHGTHVAGIASAITNNGRGVAGVSWDASLMPVKVFDAMTGTYETVALGVRYAADNGAQVVNMSLGGNEDSQVLHEAVDYAHGKGCLLIAGAGNDQNNNTLLYPARYDTVMAVGQTDQNDQRFSSNYGDGLSVMAPGPQTLSTVPGGYAYGGGTSVSTAFVSGLAALVWPVVPHQSNDQVQQLIESNAVDLGPAGWDEQYGYGRIDAGATFRSLVNLTLTPTSTAFYADDAKVLPISTTLSLQDAVSSTLVISWTAVISPLSAAWLTVTPTQGTVSYWNPAAIELRADAGGLRYGDYACELLINAQPGGMTSAASSQVYLHFVTKRYLPLILKTAALN